MKRFIILITSLLVLSGCDDGSFEVENFDFSNAATQNCNSGIDANFFLYKISNNEILLVRVPESEFKPSVTPETSPYSREIAIQGNVQVLYRLYSSNVSNNTICTVIPSTNPSIVDEWTAVTGSVEIISNVTLTENTNLNSEGATRINGLNHEIVFRNITFQKQNGNEQFYDVLNFGSYQSTAPFGFANFSQIVTLNTCTITDEQISFYRIGTVSSQQPADQSLELRLPSSLFLNEVTPEGSPRTALLSETNRFQYKISSQGLTANTYCSIPAASFVEIWTGTTGVANENGIVEVTTTLGSEGYRHRITLRNVTVRRGEISFSFGESFVIGEYVTGP